MTTRTFRRIVWAHYKKQGRHDLPWRNLPAGRQGQNLVYKILVSEIMLQQTQVERVTPFYTAFIKKFPTARKLARAPLSAVLKSWQGLGYNRRAKMLHQSSRELATRDITTVAELEMLPGVGPYTARAVAAFAFNEDVIFIETNIRTVVIHHFFPRRRRVADTELVEVLHKVFPKGRSREWYSALMDYGAFLKKSGVKINGKSVSYTKQSLFKGSLREARGALVREFTQGTTSRTRLTNLLGPTRRAQMQTALDALIKEGMINGNLL